MSQLTHAVRRSPRRARLTAGIILLMLAAFALVWIGRASAEQGQASGPAAVSKSVSTVTSKADAVDATDSPCTTSAVFTDIPGMLVSFRSAGQGSRSVLVLFQGELTVDNSTSAHIRLTIDGIVQSGPADVLVKSGGTGINTHGFNFVSDPLAPGLHVARIQWRSETGALMCVSDRSLIVLHK